MNEQELIDNLAQKLADDHNERFEWVGNDKDDLSSFRVEATIAVEMFWPLVESADTASHIIGLIPCRTEMQRGTLQQTYDLITDALKELEL